MTTIRDLKKPFDDLSDQEIFDLIRESRFLRQMQKQKPQRKTSAKAKKKSKSMPNIDKLTPAQAKKLLERIKKNVGEIRTEGKWDKGD